MVEGNPEGRLADDALLWAGLSASKCKEYVSAIEHLGRQPVAGDSRAQGTAELGIAFE